jgi:nucleoside-diphosphate-sugar epimerase
MSPFYVPYIKNSAFVVQECLMRILVNGGSGYIGSALVARLNLLGHEVEVCDIGWFGIKSFGAYQDCDITNFEVIIHLAGHSSVLMSKNDPQGSWSNNVNDFYKLVNNLDSEQKLIYASSGSVYGSGGRKPWKETDVNINSIHDYDMSKKAADVIALQAIESGKKIVGLRFGTVNGLSPNTRIDLMLNAMVYYSVTNRVIKVKNHEISRPILFLPDLLDAMTLILNSFKSGIYNLASINTTVGSAASIVSRLTGSEINVLEDDLKPYNFSLDTSSFRSTFGEFRGSTIENIVREMFSEIGKVNTGIREFPGIETLSRL